MSTWKYFSFKTSFAPRTFTGDPICSLFITGYRGEEEARNKHSSDG